MVLKVNGHSPIIFMWRLRNILREFIRTRVWTEPSCWAACSWRSGLKYRPSAWLTSSSLCRCHGGWSSPLAPPPAHTQTLRSLNTFRNCGLRQKETEKRRLRGICSFPVLFEECGRAGATRSRNQAEQERVELKVGKQTHRTWENLPPSPLTCDIWTQLSPTNYWIITVMINTMRKLDLPGDRAEPWHGTTLTQFLIINCWLMDGSLQLWDSSGSVPWSCWNILFSAETHEPAAESHLYFIPVLI